VERCIDCSREFPKEELNRKGCCLDCAIKRMREAAEQMAAHDGPYYEKWLLSRGKAVQNYRRGIKKAVKQYDRAFQELGDLATPLGQAEMIIRLGNLRNELEA